MLEYLSAIEEDNFVIAQANEPLTKTMSLLET